MYQDLEKIRYRKGMLGKGMKPDGLAIQIWRGSKIPTEIRATINTKDLLNPGCVYGD